MKKFLLLVLTVFTALAANSQSRGVKIAYIDMEYILNKVPDYASAKSQLEQKAQKWKQEIEVKKNDINKLRESLKAEKSLLTKELIEEREEEITYLETELLDYQEKRFGPKGDLMSQKSVLVKPIQDQVFTIVQDLSEQRKYDFVFDKSSDLTMLFAANRHDISDHVVRRLTRSAKRDQLSSKELKNLEEKEAQEDLAEDPEYAERQKKLEDKKAERQRLIDERKAARDAKVQAAQDKRDQLKREREAQRNGTPGNTSQQNTPNTTSTDDPVDTDDEGTTTQNRPAAETNNTLPVNKEPIQGENSTEVKTTTTGKPEEGDAASVKQQNAAQAAADEKAKRLEDRKKAVEERKKKILEERAANKKAREEEKNKDKE